MGAQSWHMVGRVALSLGRGLSCSGHGCSSWNTWTPQVFNSTHKLD